MLVTETVEGKVIKLATLNPPYKTFLSQVVEEPLHLESSCPPKGISIWERGKRKPLHILHKLIGQCTAIFSPDQQTVIGGDEQTHAYSWDVSSGKLKLQLDDIYLGKFIKRSNPDINGLMWDTDPNTLTVHPPADWVDAQGFRDDEATLQFAFVDKTHYLRFITYMPIVILYKLNNPSPIKYLHLGRQPYPAVNDYRRKQAIASSWRTHTVVIGQADGDGILVYHYDPNHKRLGKAG